MLLAMTSHMLKFFFLKKKKKYIDDYPKPLLRTYFFIG